MVHGQLLIIQNYSMNDLLFHVKKNLSLDHHCSYNVAKWWFVLTVTLTPIIRCSQRINAFHDQDNPPNLPKKAHCPCYDFHRYFRLWGDDSVINPSWITDFIHDAFPDPQGIFTCNTIQQHQTNLYLCQSLKFSWSTISSMAYFIFWIIVVNVFLCICLNVIFSPFGCNVFASYFFLEPDVISQKNPLVCMLSV